MLFKKTSTPDFFSSLFCHLEFTQIRISDKYDYRNCGDHFVKGDETMHCQHEARTNSNTSMGFGIHDHSHVNATPNEGGTFNSQSHHQNPFTHFVYRRSVISEIRTYFYL